MTMAAELIHAAGPFKRLIADRGYDTNAIRELIAQRGAEAVIPATASRRAPLPYDRHAYRLRNLIERLWCRLKLAAHRNTIRQACSQLPQQRTHRSSNHLLVQLSPEPEGGGSSEANARSTFVVTRATSLVNPFQASAPQ